MARERGRRYDTVRFMDFVFAAITDVHFGPRALFRGKLRKLSDQAPELARSIVSRMNERIKPDLVVALGDLIEDESPEADTRRYQTCVDVLRLSHAPVRFVAGNHDTINLSETKVAEAWGTKGPLHYSFDQGPLHFSVLRTIERKDVDVTLPTEQLQWLEADLAKTDKDSVVMMHHSVADQDPRENPWFHDAPHVALVANRREVRKLIARSGKVRMVINGHLHWNHVDVHDGIPYVTVQSLIENLDDDGPGRPAEASAVVRVRDRSILVEVDGAAPTRYEHHFS